MTRVTLEDGLVLIIKNLEGFNSCQEIVKVEKQTKDLTVKELIRLDAKLIKKRTVSHTFDDTKVAGHGLVSSAKKVVDNYTIDYNDAFYELDDYIDITELTKEE